MSLEKVTKQAYASFFYQTDIFILPRKYLLINIFQSM